MNPPVHIHTPDTDLSPLLSTLSELIRHSRQKALRVVDTLQVQTCWNMGRHIIEHEQAGAARAEYGKQLLPTLAGQPGPPRTQAGSRKQPATSRR